MTRRLTISFLALVLFLPLSVGAVEFSECEEGSVSCTCTPEDAVPLEDQTLIGNTEDCQKYCTDVSDAEETVTGYSLQCTVEGEITTISQAGLDSLVDDFNEYYYEDPALSVSIPGLEFTSAYQDGDTFVSNYLGEYVAAVYNWLLSAATLLAIIVIMIAGLQWMLARGNQSRITSAKNRLKNAITGLVLLLGAYSFAYIMDPSTLTFDPFTTSLIAQRLDEDTSGSGEGVGSDGSVDGTLPGEVGADCEEAIANGIASGACTMSESFGSPTGGAVSCNYHFSDGGYNWADINSLDYVAEWGANAYAPFSGTITHFYDGDGNACGNGIGLSGSGGSVYICHLKDWAGTTDGQTVVKGDLIGSVGGRCCSGESPPSDWSAGSYCTYSGTPCSGADSIEDCDCQPWEQSGNTTGGHTHISYVSGGNLIACFDDSNY